MPLSQKSYENNTYIILALCAMMLMGSGIVIGLSLEASPPMWQKLFAFFLAELGVAIIIALIIIGTIESFSRAKHKNAADALIDDINKNLFYAIYKKYIPASLFAEVEKCLFNTNVIRTNHKLDYTIEDIPQDVDDKVDNYDHMQCDVTSRYKLKNITDHDIKHIVKVVLELPVDRSWSDKVKINEVKIRDDKLSVEDIRKATKLNTNQLIFTHEITIAATAEISISVMSTLLKRKDDAEIWSSFLPSDGIELTVSTPSQDIEVFAGANNSAKLEKVLDNKSTKKWELNNAIFPHQSLVFWWRKKLTSSTNKD